MNEGQGSKNLAATHERVPVRNLAVWATAVSGGALAGAAAGVALRSDVAAILLGVLGAFGLAWLSQRLMRRVVRPVPRHTVCRPAAQNALLGFVVGFLAGDGLGVILGFPQGWSGLVGATAAMAASAVVTERWYNARARKGSRAGVANQ